MNKGDEGGEREGGLKRGRNVSGYAGVLSLSSLHFWKITCLFGKRHFSNHTNIFLT